MKDALKCIKYYIEIAYVRIGKGEIDDALLDLEAAVKELDILLKKPIQKGGKTR